MMNDYETTRPTAFTVEECRAAVGKKATISLTGQIVSYDVSDAGPFVRFAIDERWGLGDFKLGMDLDAFALEGDAPDVREALRLLGFALFNLGKGKTEATQTLIEKARAALGAPAWDA